MHNVQFPTSNSQEMRFGAMFVVALFLAAFAATSVSAQSVKAAMQQDPACQSLTPVSAGGPSPKDPETVVVRWLGWTNYEIAYRGDVFLLDAYYDRGPRMHPIGVAPADIKKANAIFIGHAHFDHMSDAAAVAKQTGAPVIGASFASEVLTRGGVPAKQFTAVKGGEVMRYPGVTAARRDPRPRQPQSKDLGSGCHQLPVHLRQRLPSAVYRQSGPDHRGPARTHREGARRGCRDAPLLRLRGRHSTARRPREGIQAIDGLPRASRCGRNDEVGVELPGRARHPRREPEDADDGRDLPDAGVLQHDVEGDGHRLVGVRRWSVRKVRRVQKVR
jgi:hypothetical protein